jgi:hypothetical protein
MTPEEAAKNLCSRIPKPGLIHPDWLEEQVCTLIRDAYERAALVADAAIDPEWPGDDLSNQARGIASDIRALKGPAA